MNRIDIFASIFLLRTRLVVNVLPLELYGQTYVECRPYTQIHKHAVLVRHTRSTSAARADQSQCIKCPDDDLVFHSAKLPDTSHMHGPALFSHLCVLLYNYSLLADYLTTLLNCQSFAFSRNHKRLERIPNGIHVKSRKKSKICKARQKTQRCQNARMPANVKLEQ